MISVWMIYYMTVGMAQLYGMLGRGAMHRLVWL